MNIRKRFKNKKENIKLWIEIERRVSSSTDSYIQKILYETDNVNATVATALSDINGNEYRDEDGKLVAPITWQCSCLQKKCGACAMVVNGVPKLACDSFLRDYKKTIRLSPLHKFPVVRDLMVDRNILYSNLKTMNTWLENPSNIEDRDQDIVFESSKCLLCGCCLEVCPNFEPDQSFYGAAVFVPITGILSSTQKLDRGDIAQKYMKYIYEGCGKSLSCQSICPANIDMENMLIHSNKISIWKNKK